MQRTMLVIGLLAVLAAGGAVSCEKIKASYEESFRKSWRESFVKNCIGNKTEEEQKAMCNCVADYALEDLTVKELHDISGSTDYITKELIPACKADLGY